MSLLSTPAADILNQLILGTTPSWSPGTMYAALSDGSSEVAGTGYARIALSMNTVTSAQPSVATEADEINFGTVAGDWTPVAGIDETWIYSALTGGTRIATDSDTAITYSVGNRAFIAAGLTFSFGTNSLFSAAYSNSINDWLFASGATPSRARYLGLLNSGAELTGGNYARLDTDNSASPFFGSATAGASETDPASITFTATQNFLGGTTTATFTGTVNQYGLYAAATGGSPLITVSVSSQPVASGDTIEVNPTITLT